MMNDLLRYLFALTIASSTAIVITLLIRRPVRRAFGAAASYSAWLLVPVAMVAMLLPNATDAESPLTVYLQIGSVSALSLAVERSLSSSLGAASSVDWPTWLLGVWCAGAALFVAYLVGLQRAYLISLGTLSGSRGVLRAQASAGCPALVGVFRPKVILPADFETRYTPQEQSLVLAHERVHLRRRDTLWNALVALLRCLFWFNPLVHLAASRLRVDQELACDAAVIDLHPGSRRAYAGAMLKTQLADAALPVGCHWRSAHPFKERLEMLKQSAPGRVRRACGGAFVAIATLVVGYAAWAAEPATTPASPVAAPVAAVKTQPPAPASAVKQGEAETSGPSSAPEPMPSGVLAFGPELKVETSAESARSGPDGGQILEGNVRIDASPLSGSPTRTVKVRRLPSGESSVESVVAQTMTVKAERAVVTPLGPGGGVKVTFENGTVEMH